MGYSHFDDLINIGNEGQAILRGDQVFLFLLGDTADTTGVASWRDRYSHLPAFKKQVASGRAGVVERTVSVLGNNPILGMGSLFLITRRSSF